MPSNIIKSFAKQTGNTQKYVEELWEKAKDITEKEYKLKPTSKKYYSIVTGILKKMLKLNEDNNSNEEEDLNLLTDSSKFNNVIMKWTGDANEGIGEKSTENIHPLDKTEPDIGGATRPASNYERLVLYALAKLVDQQSSTPYLNYPEVAKQVDQFMRTPEADKIIKKCTNRSPEYCAEILFDIYPKFQNESISKKELKLGIEVEKEHKDVYDMFKKILDKKNIKMPLSLNQFAEIIAKSHLEEMENYYTELRKMESQLKK